MRFPNLGLISIAILGLLLAIPGRAAGQDAAANRSKYPTTLQQRLGQIPLAPVQIVGVQFNPTASGIEVIFATASGQPIQAKTQPDGKTLLITIDNAVLAPTGQPLVNKSTIEGIVGISVTQQAGNRVEVRVFGDRSLPTATIGSNPSGLILAVTASKDEELEITVTGERGSSYRVPSTSSATRTDTPLRDIPQSIQVVPQQVLKDQKVVRLKDAVQNVSGVFTANSFGGALDNFNIRGFEDATILKDGVKDTFSGGIILKDFANVERIEVIKGPGSVLFGNVEPGGLINVATKQPLATPLYSADLSIGSYSSYRPTIDLSGPLNPDKSLRYRLNAAYDNAGSFRDSVSSERVFIAPVVSYQINDRTALTVDGSYLYDRRSFDRGIVAFGTGVADIPIDRFLGEKGDFRAANQFTIGYKLEHRFNENLKVRNSGRFSDTNQFVNKSATAIGLDETTGELARAYFDDANRYKTLSMQTDLVNNFKTGSIDHQLVVGFDLQRNMSEGFFAVPSDAFDATFTDRFTPNINIFNPTYNLRPRPDLSELGLVRNDAQTTDGFGIFLQDRIAITDNLKFLVGGRFDTSTQRRTDKLDNNSQTSQSDRAFSPRIGVVYQPIQPISLYASYSQSFAPNSGVRVDGSILEPTRGNQYEVGIKAEIDRRVTATLSAYQITKKNVATTDPDNNAFSLPIGEQRSRGIEFDVSGTILPGWNVIASYSSTNAEISRSNDLPVGNKIPNVPNNKMSLWTTYDLQQGELKGLGFGLGLYYVDKRPGDLNNSFELPSYLRTDAAIYYKKDNWRAGINIQNVFNSRYFENSDIGRTTVTPGAPLTIAGTFSISF